MNDIKRLSLENTFVDYVIIRDKVVVMQYSGTPDRVIKELAERVVKGKTLGGFNNPYFGGDE